MTDIIVVLLVLSPVVLTFILKSNAALAYLALGAGYTLESLAGNDINNVLVNLKASISTVDLYLILIAAPPLVTLFSSTRSWAGQSKMLPQLLVALGMGGVLAALAMPLISTAVDTNLYNSVIWKNLQHIKSSLIIAETILALVMIWLSKTRHPDKKHK